VPLRALVTGFEPFGDSPYNPSGEAARALDGRSAQGLVNGRQRSGVVIGRVLPVLWTVAGEELVSLVRSLRPHIVVSLGMAADTFRVEQRADDAQIDATDNHGRRPPSPRAEPTRSFPTRLPVAAIERAIRRAGGAVSPSEDAGGFICGDVFFALMATYRSSAAELGLLRAGFIHVPNDRFVARPGVRPFAKGWITQAALDDAVLAAVAAAIADLTPEEYGQIRP
jgi:pyroglutamyl-peptidase